MAEPLDRSSTPGTRLGALPELTGIRGFAACWVLAFHIWLVAGSPRMAWLGIDTTSLLACGWAGVDVFFVLSGFVLTWSYGDAGAFSYLDFLRRRSLRVLPAYYLQFVLLVLLALLGLFQATPGFGNAIAHLFLVHNVKFEWNSPLPNTWWTLPIEWQFYLIFPFVLRLLPGKRLWLAFPVILILVLGWRMGVSWWLQTGNPTASVDYKVWIFEQLPGRLDQFFIGMLAAHLTRHYAKRSNPHRQAIVSNSLVVVGVVALLALTATLWPLANEYWNGHWLLFVWHLLAAFPIALAISGAALGGRLARISLANKGMQWLGNISYSLYLWNYVILVALAQSGVFDYLSSPYKFLRVAALGAGCSLLVATASWWLAERPFLHYRDRTQPDGTRTALAKVIRAPWWGVALTLLVVCTMLGIGRVVSGPASIAAAQCLEKGHIDSPDRLSVADEQANIQGWVIDANRLDPVVKVVAVADAKVVGTSVPGETRTDVSDAFTSCKPTKPGFSMPLDLALLPTHSTSITVAAERSSGKRFSIGTLDWRFDAIRVSIDKSSPPTVDGENTLEGWAWHASGAVKVTWRIGQQVLGETTADLPRQDVADRFKSWQGAERSGFGLRVRFGDLPRGQAKSVIEFRAPDGTTSTAPGPDIDNAMPLGFIVKHKGLRLANPTSLPVEAWLYDETGITKAEAFTELGTHLGTLKKIRDRVPLPDLSTDPRGVPPGDYWRKALNEGELYGTTVQGKSIPAGVQRIVVKATNRLGKQVTVPGPLIITGPSRPITTCTGKPFTAYLWATIPMMRGGMPALAELRQIAESGCFRFGIHARVEYLRTTKGKNHDYEFDPDFPDSVRILNGREMTTSSLSEALRMADRYHVPMRILLDGGVWADSLFSAPDWDITDWQELDDKNVQWNQFGKTEPDDALRGLAGGHDNPQLGRVIALNIYNDTYRRYKKRNLQSAVKVIVQYNRTHPTAPVSISMDPDLYVNPWFYLKEWYDYNPDTLRQFREWLTSTGPYLQDGILAGQGYKKPLTLDAINTVAGKNWKTLDEVDPPRASLDYSSPWHQLWTAFKRHLVGRHYADLAAWAHEAGLSPDLIFTAQTFIQADVSVTGDDAATGWVDEAGVSIKGAKPPTGHMGVILYGPASRNSGRPRSGPSLFANIAATDPDWEVVEMNPADISKPDVLPSHDQAYRTLSNIFNYGARAISPMWNGTAADQSVRPSQFKSYEVFSQSPFETQLVLFSRAIASLPKGSNLWTFGNAYVASDDGFSGTEGTKVEARLGELSVDRSGTGPCQLVKKLEGLSIPRQSLMRIDGYQGIPGSVTVADSTGKTAVWPMKRISDTSVEIALSVGSETHIDEFRIFLPTCPATLRQISIVGSDKP